MSADDSEDEPKPKKQDTKKVSKKPSAEKKALDPAGEPPPKAKTGKTKKVAKPEDAPPPEPADEDKKDDDSSEKPKSATGKLKKPLSKSDAKAGGKARRAGPPAPAAPPAVRGGLDYALAVLAPLAAGGLGAYAFMGILTALGRCKNPILADSIPNPVVDIPKAALEDLSFMASFPWIPIVSGVVVGLLATLCLLKMAPGIGARLMGGGMMAFAILSTMPFVMAGPGIPGLGGGSIQFVIKQKLRSEYAVPRGGDVDPRVLDFKGADFEKARLLALWKVDLDEGEIPLSWIATSDDPVGDGGPDDEKKIKNYKLRYALSKGHEYAATPAKLDADVWKKMQDLRDKANQEILTPGDETTKLDEEWRKFEGRAKDKLAKPAPRKEPWFDRWTLFGDFSKQGIAKDDCAFYQRYYFGKAIHKAVKDLPADLRFAGCFRAEVKVDAPVEPLTKYDFCWLCYDLEKPDREPVMLPHIKGILDEATFAIEVLGQK